MPWNRPGVAVMNPGRPLPPSTSSASVASGIAGDSPEEDARTGNRDGSRTSIRVPTSAQRRGMVTGSRRTSASPASSKDRLAHSSARRIPSVPAILGPMPSQSARKSDSRRPEARRKFRDSFRVRRPGRARDGGECEHPSNGGTSAGQDPKLSHAPAPVPV